MPPPDRNYLASAHTGITSITVHIPYSLSLRVLRLYMASWHKSEEEASKLREVNRAA